MSKILTERKSNIELLRIVAMILVLLVHSNYFSLGGVEHSDIQSFSSPEFIRVLAEQLCIICVNLYILISGWFGIKPSIKGVLSLLFQVFFYHILISIIILCIGAPFSIKGFIKVFCFGVPYWFVISYLVLYALSPALNSFIDKVSPKLLLSTILSFFILEFSTGWCINFAGFNEGYSAIHFIGLYLLARYIRLYSCKLVNFSAKIDFTLYIILTLFPVLLFYGTGRSFNMLAYSSPFVIGAAVFFLLAFNRMQIYSNIINNIAISVFSVYLIHQHPFLYQHYQQLMQTMYSTLSGWGYVIFVLAFAFLFTLLCVAVDKIRILIWRYTSNKIVNNIASKLEYILNKVQSLI